MITITTWHDKLVSDLAITASEVNTIGFARDLPNLRAGRSKSLPAVFVLPLSVSAKPIDSSQTTGDYITQFVEIVYITRDCEDDMSDSLIAIRSDVHTSLLGWMPTGTVYPCHYVRGARTGYKDGMISWSDVFKLEFTRTAV